MDFSTKLNHFVRRIEQALDQHVPAHPGPESGPTRIHEAMRYSLQAGGKRLRPVLLLATAEHFPSSSPLPDPLPAAAALECLHTYSLIHDDLPCMDDDDLRRGRPTAHKAYDEATALLAGDALLTHAFGLLAHAYAPHPALAVALLRTLAETAGASRLIGGQMQDLLAERTSSPASPAELDYIHLNKTAAMIETALEMGGLLAGTDLPTLTRLRQAGRHLGLAFQIIDDILDATSDASTLGKTPGKDALAGKATYVTLHGLDAARRHADAQTTAALDTLGALNPTPTFLLTLIETMATRRH